MNLPLELEIGGLYRTSTGGRVRCVFYSLLSDQYTVEDENGDSWFVDRNGKAYAEEDNYSSDVLWRLS